MKLLETMSEKTWFEVKVSTMDITSSEKTITGAYYHYLTHDKVRMKIVSSQKDSYADLGCYASNMAQGLQIS